MTTLCLDGQDLPDFSVDQCGVFSNEGQGIMSESIQKHANEAEKVGTHSSSSINKHAPEELLLLTSENSTLPAARDADAWLAPGKIVWFKDIHHGWWPAEVMDTEVLKDNDCELTARALVQLLEIHKRAWVNASDLSQFPNNTCVQYFEERSKNPSEVFQIALKQALSKLESISLGTSQDGFAVELRSPTQTDKSPDASKTSISSSSSKDDHDEEGGRGKRKRKTKIHFDEMAVADNPARKLRRMKIMRQLGLAAPVGSPFSTTHRSS
ncbi:uncharacterized protein LOC110032098 isoform X2 [Phalaenopsis equestris]|uniref:uncharacterized protein LOC110032098 isoform X2 n=1 Tax=Phalaenopsis equestris TaxID=78828 RepID=UPI0009E3FF5B|nr:uncharacterized protein LOC110032098 isoform X2 [Phalaenopsis equestris]